MTAQRWHKGLETNLSYRKRQLQGVDMAIDAKVRPNIYRYSPLGNSHQLRVPAV